MLNHHCEIGSDIVISEPMLDPIEGAIRAFTPCSGCALRVLGVLPLQLELLIADAAVRDRATR